MSNTLYITRNRRVDTKLNKLVDDNKLVTCYRDRNQRIFKNEKLIVSQKKKYIFLRLLSDEDINLLPNLYHYLVGVQI